MTTSAEHAVVAGLGEIKISNNPDDVLTCLGLGSCIGLGLYDPVAKVGGMAHIVLPDSGGRTASVPGKFADEAIPNLIMAVVAAGGMRSRMKARMAGGAQMTGLNGPNSIFAIGVANADATRKALAEAGIRLLAEDVGGNSGRTLRLWMNTGEMTVSYSGKDTKQL